MVWAVVEHNLVLYADEGRIAGMDHIWVQDALVVTVEIFRWVVLENNFEKTNTLVLNITLV